MASKRRTNFKENITEDNFNGNWSACHSWLELSPASYQGKFYVKDYEDGKGTIEQILVDKVPEDIKTLIELVWEDAIQKHGTQLNSDFAKYVSEELNYELPFRNSINADHYVNFNYGGEQLRVEYMQSFNPYRKLSGIYEQQQANCVAHALAIKEVIPEKGFQLFNVCYDNVYDTEGFEKLGIHTILAKQVGNKIIAIDSNEGERNNKDKTNPFNYEMSIETFSKHFAPALIKAKYIEKK